MTVRVVEISADAVAGVRSDVAAVRESLDADWGSLRSRALALGVRTSGFDDVLGAGDRLGTHVLPVVDRHLDRARALEQLRYGTTGRPLPVLDVDPAPLAVPFTSSPIGDGGTTLTWAATSSAEVAADQRQTEESRGIGDWFSDRWDDVSDAVDDGTDWVPDTAGEAWEAVTEAGAAVGDWWERTTADLGTWIDTHLTGVREFIGRHVAVFRFLADALRIVGWILVVVGVVLSVALAIIGAMGGTAAGAVFGFGVGAVPGGAAGAVAGLSFGLKVLGVGFTLVAVGDFLDVAADWGEGKIAGQDLVKLGSLELGLALTSLIGVGVVGKILQKAVKHMPASWRRRILDLVHSDPTLPSRAPDPEAVPGGRPTRIKPRDDPPTRRSLERENDSARTLAREGYDVVQNPVVPGRKKPDYLIEGRVFDALSPSTPTARNVRSAIDKKIQSGQTSRIVLNLDDTVVTRAQVIAALRAEPVEGLREVLVVEDGAVSHLRF
ncbi:hypothetical protein J1G44_00850 [Cellulomonas sp. zg-ZUI199]|uniref:tRNA nuclease CdiA C-terminal domain-containing protein n=1 Tax=Cellulomonas wangleii TaxID=2816956 RepID=A0ABX8D1R5_9CELL|nr:hypothetical protein [Cellulomonas wangleii]MBO0923031.1 hypothetical protein [Cellulomonas wangleii]QVI61416.1 hypothetical protein KG103_13135 [Cellulomonas wangleii]